MESKTATKKSPETTPHLLHRVERDAGLHCEHDERAKLGLEYLRGGGREGDREEG